MLLYTVLGGMVQRLYPGARQAGQALMFPNPAYAGEPLRLEVTEIAALGDTHRLTTRVRHIADGAVPLDGDTTIQLPIGGRNEPDPPRPNPRQHLPQLTDLRPPGPPRSSHT